MKRLLVEFSEFPLSLLKVKTFGLRFFFNNLSGQMFWGKDQLDYIEQLLKGNDLTEGSDGAVKHWAETPRGADRKEYVAAKAKL